MARPITPADMGSIGKAAFANASPLSAADLAPGATSPLARRLKERERHIEWCDMPEFAKILEEPNPKLGFRVAVVAEQDAALVGAYNYIEKQAEKAPLIAKDEAFITAAKTCHILANVVLLPNGLPAFPDAPWIRETFTAYEVNALLERYNAVVQKMQPGAGEVKPEWVADVAMKCAEHEGTNIPDIALEGCSRFMLVEMFIRLAMLWRTACEENEVLRAAVAGYEQDSQPEAPSIANPTDDAHSAQSPKQT